MFNIGGGELLLIALVALIVVGPDQLPSVMRRAGQYANQLRGMTTGIRDEFMAGVDEFDPSKWDGSSGTKPVSKPIERGDGSISSPVVPKGYAERQAAGEPDNPFANNAPAVITEAEQAAAEAAERTRIAKAEMAERAESARAAARERLAAQADEVEKAALAEAERAEKAEKAAPAEPEADFQ